MMVNNRMTILARAGQQVSALFPLLGLDLPEVELQLFSLENVSVSPATLAGPGGDRGEDATWEIFLISILRMR